LAVRTRDAYGQHVGSYGAWLAGRPEPGVAITEPRGRDHAARDFKRHLKVERGWKPASVNLALAAVDHFNRFLGLRPWGGEREAAAAGACGAQSAVGGSAAGAVVGGGGSEASRSRDRDAAALHGAAPQRARRLGCRGCRDLGAQGAAGGALREGGCVPGGAVEPAVPCRAGGVARGKRAAERERALFVGPQGGRLSPRSVDRVVRGVASRAGLLLSAHVLRHTCVTNLVRGGNDIVLVAELAGHRRLETTRRYSLPSAADRQAAMEALELEE